MFTVKMYRKEHGKEVPAYQNYEASFQIIHAAEVYARSLETNVSAYRITIVNNPDDTTYRVCYNKHWGCPICFDRRELFQQFNVCEKHKICPKCKIKPISLDSYDLKEYGWCTKCIEPEAKYLASCYAKERLD